MNLAGHHISTAALAPLLLYQGLNVRRSVLKLPEPAGKRIGVCGQGEPLRLLILGDSAAAGVGATQQRDALSGQIAQALSKHVEVRWRVFAKTGETTQSTLGKLERLSSNRFDVAVTSLGVNDVTAGMTLKRWRRLQSELRSRLRTELGIERIIVSSLPQMSKFPALPQPLRWHLGARARLFNEMMAAELKTEPDCTFLPIDSIDKMDLIAEDGFHPGPKAYAIWGELAADLICREFVH